MGHAANNITLDENPRPASAPGASAAPANILLVDHDELVRESVTRTLTRGGHRVVPFGDARTALAQLAAEPFGLLIAEAKLPGMTGIELLEEARKQRPDMPVILMAAYTSMRAALEAMRRGADDFIQKPFEKDELLLLVSGALENAALRRENLALRHAAGLGQPPATLVGGSAAATRARDAIQRLAANDAPVLIRGERGTGKELAARLIHAASDRRGRPLLVVNCAALDGDLLDIELFGRQQSRERAARRGLFELADRGTLLLKEVAAIAPALQAKLRGAILQHSFEPAGGGPRQHADVRLLATAGSDLEEAMAPRGDLLTSLRPNTLELAPLRDRREDIADLVRHFLHRIARRRAEPFRHIEPEALRALQRYAWPGNVRELMHIMERAAAVETQPAIVRAATISPWLAESASPNGHRHLTVSGDPLDRLPLAEVEKRVILDTLAKFEGHRAKTAGALGIGIRTLGIKLKKWRQDGALVEMPYL